MKQLICIILLTIISCNNSPQKESSSDNTISDTSKSLPNTKINRYSDICWTGTIDEKIPVFIRYQLDSNLIIGEITYLNSKDKLPIPLLGLIEEDKSYMLMEFEKSGNISGIIRGYHTGEVFYGNWFSPEKRIEFVLNLVKKDTVINPLETETKLEDVFGQYHYQFSEEGNIGDFEITQLPDSKAIFEIGSVTEAPGRNMAEINKDTISLTATHFVYSLPNTNDCEFEVKFYKGFAFIRYTKGYCEGQFGFNASIDGIFLKVN